MYEKINPWFNPEKLGGEYVIFSEEGLSYEFNDCMFWRTDEGTVFFASDSGCSCPTPFEGYEGATPRDVEQLMERCENEEYARRIFDSWNKGYNNKFYVNTYEAYEKIGKLFKQ